LTFVSDMAPAGDRMRLWSTGGMTVYGSLQLNAGAIIDSAKVVADTLKFYVGGTAYKAIK
jgi:hypothetical protein